MLAVTAALKLWYLFTTPLTGSLHPDPVLGVLSHREALLVAAFFEVTLVYAIIRSRDLWRTGAYLLYFASCMTLYQIGLLVMGVPGCGCLGAANDMLESELATGISRGLLATFWLAGIFLVSRRPAVAERRSSSTTLKGFSQPHMLLLLVVEFFFASSSHGGVAIQATGRFTYTHERQGKPITETTEFEVLFDNDALKLTETARAVASQRYGMPELSTNILYVAKDVLLIVIRCGATDRQPTAGFDRPAYAWELGNCGGTLETCVFLTVRCEELFAKSTDRRRIAPPWTTIGQAVGLLFEARYDWIQPGQADQELVGKMVVSEALKRGWFQSEFRAPVLTMYPDLMIEEKNSIKAYRPGFVGGTMRFTQFTNVAGISFPTRSEFTAFSPRMTNNGAGESGASREATYSVAFERIELTSKPMKVLPIEAEVVTVTDRRLFDHVLGVGFGRYQTNSLHTFEISALARQDFESRREEARRKLRLEWLRRVLFAALFTTIVLGPVVIGVLRRRRSGVLHRTV